MGTVRLDGTTRSNHHHPQLQGCPASITSSTQRTAACTNTVQGDCRAFCELLRGTVLLSPSISGTERSTRSLPSPFQPHACPPATHSLEGLTLPRVDGWQWAFSSSHAACGYRQLRLGRFCSRGHPPTKRQGPMPPGLPGSIPSHPSSHPSHVSPLSRSSGDRPATWLRHGMHETGR